MQGAFNSPILSAPVLEGEQQSLSGTEVDIPGVGKVIFAPQSASDFPNMEMTHQELVMRYWHIEIAIKDLTTRLQALELMAHGRRDY